eukprot:CAMPEP_0206221762 /NCGR_PEP_ID=MMETSP0047_2-20121206/5593_1 /ASSEMBLY_ACC=CAM_ASM_000192 /TAXON_ID=195065 /ORGANISM="Chroomonas mesostigmatica_cf, Strain CCMP1168" /LENGTH=107 /DNA_ID=CAMNT_0053644529 /DNA_START=54 /DNA_END=377 /DNA_ORIENTATION=+
MAREGAQPPVPSDFGGSFLLTSGLLSAPLASRALSSLPGLLGVPHSPCTAHTKVAQHYSGTDWALTALTAKPDVSKLSARESFDTTPPAAPEPLTNNQCLWTPAFLA